MNNNSEIWSDATVLSVETNNTKKLIYYFNKFENKFYICLGEKKDNIINAHRDLYDDFVDNNGQVDYWKKIEIVVKNDLSKIEESYIGEVTSFENNNNMSINVFNSLAHSILYRIETNIYCDLKSAINELIQFLESYSSDNAELKLQGYIAELLLIKKIADIDSGVATKFIKKFHKTDDSTYDFSINESYKVEVKSTKSRNFIFKVKDDQKSSVINGSNVLYAFIKINKARRGEDGAKNIRELLDYLISKLDIQEDQIITNLESLIYVNGWKEHYYDCEDFESVYIMSSELPDFFNIRTEYCVRDINYNIDMRDFTKKINYIIKDREIEMIEFIKKGLAYE